MARKDGMKNCGENDAYLAKLWTKKHLNFQAKFQAKFP